MRFAWPQQENKSKKPTVSKNRLVFTWTVFILVLVCLIFMWWVDHQLSRPLKSWAELRIKTLGQRAITEAVQGILSEVGGDFQDDLIRKISEDQDLNVAWSYDWVKLNKIDAEITSRVLENLDKQLEERIPVPLGELLGIQLLAGSGPAVGVRIVPAGTISTELRFTFQSVGINQVLHQIGIFIDMKMRVIAPMVASDVHVTEEIPISTVIFQGKVPEVFVEWGSGSMDDFLNRGLLKGGP
jgi:sporulation protein YunB